MTMISTKISEKVHYILFMENIIQFFRTIDFYLMFNSAYNNHGTKKKKKRFIHIIMKTSKLYCKNIKYIHEKM